MASQVLSGLHLPLRYEGGTIKDGTGKTIIKAERDGNITPLQPVGRDAILALCCVLLNEAFEYDKAQRVLSKLGY